MIRKAIILCVLILLFMFCLNLTSFGRSSAPAEESAGYALLDSLIVAFKELAAWREAVIERTRKALVTMMKEANKAKAQGQIDTVFFKRFHRILMVINCVITPIPKDGAGIMKPLYFGAISQFIEDIEGEPFDLEKVGENEFINKFTEAISHELIELRIYLDNKGKREELIEEYQELLSISKDPSELVEKDKQLMSMKDIATINVALSDYVTIMEFRPNRPERMTGQANSTKPYPPSTLKSFLLKTAGETVSLFTPEKRAMEFMRELKAAQTKTM